MKIAILGAAGRMGQNLLRCASKFDCCTIVAATECPGHPAVGSRVKAVSGMLNIEAIPDALCYTDQWPEQAEAVIDFTFHTTVVNHLSRAVENGQGRNSVGSSRTAESRNCYTIQSAALVRGHDGV